MSKNFWVFKKNWRSQKKNWNCNAQGKIEKITSVIKYLFLDDLKIIMKVNFAVQGGWYLYEVHFTLDLNLKQSLLKTSPLAYHNNQHDKHIKK